MAPPPGNDAQKVAALRELLPATAAGIYLDSATAGPLPAETAAAMREAEDRELRVGRAVAGREADVAQREAEARAVVAALIGADPAEVQLTAGLAAAVMAGLAAVDWRAGDRLLASALNDPLVIDAVRAFGRLKGVEVDVADAVEGKLRSRTRLVLLPDVAPTTGERLPAAEIRATLADPEILLGVDATQSAGAVPVAVVQLGADFVAFATDTWALAPEGTAAVWMRTPLQSSARVVAGGRLPRTTLLGVARSIGWLEMYVGLEWAFERGQRLARWLAAELARLDGVEVLTPPARMATIVTFRLAPAWSAEEAVDELGRRVFAILRPLPGLRALRASVAWFNSEEELERFVAAVAELAQHTPDTLPRRPSLTVL